MEITRGFKQISSSDVGMAGGKGASLGEMIQAGIPVPPGFVVVSDSFERFINETEIKEDIDSILHNVNHKDVASVERASEEIQAIILSQEMPEDIKKDIISNFDKLDAEFVAVRSSATAEDSASAAWAGQLDTFLNTRKSELLDNIRKCWASLFTPRAIFYRFEKGLHDDFISVAVVVQKMIQSEVSGIAFSVHPVTQDHNQMIIEAGFGLGEAIVSGQITPDSYIIEKDKMEITETHLSGQERQLVKGPDGGVKWKDVLEPGKRTIDESQVKELAELIIKLEDHYGFPVDVEWGLEDGKFYILQSRPITTLTKESDVPKKARGREEPSRWFYFGKYDENVLYSSIWMKSIDADIFHSENIIVNEIRNVESQWFLCQESMNKFREMLRSKLDDQDFDWFQKLYETIENKIRAYEREDFDLKGFFEKSSELAGYAFFNEFLAFFLEDYLIEKGKAELLDDIRPHKPTLLMQYKSSLKEKEINVVVKEFEWVGVHGFQGEPLTREKALEDKKSFKENETSESNDSLVELGSRMAWLRSYVSEVIDKRGYELIPELENMNPAYRNYTFEEIINQDFGRKAKENASLIYRVKKGFEFLNEDSAKEFLERNISKDSSLEGRVAQKGKVRGKAVIVENPEQNDKVSEGDIMIVNETSPAFLPAMRKAAAFVASIGGITSHTAIVAREMKKPCIIGVAGITYAVKDGDIIEVDADKGGVRILEKAKSSEPSSDDEWVFMWSNTPMLPSIWASARAIADRSDILMDISSFQHFNGKILKSFVKKKDIYKYKNESKKFLDEEFYKEYVKDFEQEYDEWWKWIRNIEQKDYSNVAKEELIEDFETFNIYQRDALGYFWTNRPETTYSVEQELKEHIQKEFDTWLDVFSILATSPEWDEIQKEERDWNALSSGKLSRDKLLLHASKHPWLVFGQFDDEEVLSFFRERGSVESVDNMEKKSVLKKKQRKYLDALSDRCEYLSHYLQEQSIRRMEIKAYWAGSYYLSRKLWKEIERRLDTSIKNLMWYISPPEITEMLEGTFSGDLRNLIENRKKGYAIEHAAGGDLELLEYNESEKLFKERIIHEKKKTSVQGQTASPGKYKGKVRKVIPGDLDMLKEDMKKFSDGEVLVTSMTQPNMMAIAKKAGAIVADEGGITSHAAIISRELEIPCIVGCLEAMQVFQDGDLVEVDADEGVVKIITKSGEDEPEWCAPIERYETVLMFDFIMRGIGRARAKEKLGLDDGMTRYLGLNPKVYWTRGDMDRLGKYYSQFMQDTEGLKLLNKLMSFWKKTGQNLISKGNELGKRDWNSLETSEMAKEFDEFKQLNWDNSTAIFPPLIVEKGLTERVKKKLEEVSETVEEDFLTLIYPREESESTKELVNFYSLAGKIKSETDKWDEDSILAASNPDIQEMIKKHLDRFSWLGTRWMQGEGWKVEDLIERIVSLDPDKDYAVLAKQLNETTERNKEDVEELFKKYEFTDYEKELVWIAKDFVYLRTYRTDMYNKASYLAKPFLIEIGKRLSMDYDHVIMLSSDEIIEGLVNGVSFNIEERMDGDFGAEFIDGRFTVLQGEEVRERRKKMAQYEPEETDVIRGSTANGGKIKGTVRVVRNRNDFHKVKQGDILVTIMTSPDFIPVMQKAAAFVTNEGGITCHASIVSREMDKPCIIGTRNATEMLKDGDVVEVDADEGIVRRIE